MVELPSTRSLCPAISSISLIGSTWLPPHVDLKRGVWATLSNAEPLLDKCNERAANDESLWGGVNEEWEVNGKKKRQSDAGFLLAEKASDW